MVVALLDPQAGERVLDACAAPGGKALFAAARMQGRVSPCTVMAGDCWVYPMGRWVQMRPVVYSCVQYALCIARCDVNQVCRVT